MNMNDNGDKMGGVSVIIRVIKVSAIVLFICLGVSPATANPDVESEYAHECLIGLGVEGGVYHEIMSLVKENAASADICIDAIETEGSWDNLQNMVDGNIDFGLVQLDAIGVFRDPLRDSLVAIRPLYQEYLHIMVRNTLRMNDLSGIAGMHINIGSMKSGTRFTATILLGIIGISPNQCHLMEAESLAEIRQLVEREEIDALFYVGALGSNFVSSILSQNRYHLLSLSSGDIKKISTSQSGERLRTTSLNVIENGTYPHQQRRIKTISVPVLLLAGPHVRDSLLIAAVDKLVLEAMKSPQLRSINIGGSALFEPVYLPSAINLVLFYPEMFLEAPGLLIFLRDISVFLLILAFLYWLVRKNWSKIIRLFRIRKIAVVFVFLVTICLSCAVGIYVLERSINSNFESMAEAFWSISIYLTSGLEDRIPLTAWGRILASILMASGPIFLTVMAGFFASSIILNSLEKKMSQNLKDHYVILNWSNRTLEVIEQIHAPVLGDSRRSVVVVMSNDPTLNLEELQKRFSDQQSNKSAFEDVFFYPGDPCDEHSLLNVNAQDAKAVVIMADPKDRDRADEKTIRTLLALQKIVEDKGNGRHMHAIAELMNSDNSSVVENIARHFPGVIDSVAGGQIRTLLLAQATLIPGLTKFYRDLLYFDKETNEIYSLEIPSSAVGLEFGEYAGRVISHTGRQPMIPVGLIRDENGHPTLVTNPRRKDDDGKDNKYYRLVEGDRLLIICYDAPHTKDLPA